MAEMQQCNMVACMSPLASLQLSLNWKVVSPDVKAVSKFAAGMCRAGMHCLAASAGGIPKQTNLIMECYKCCRISNT